MQTSQKPLQLFHGNSNFFGKPNSFISIQQGVKLPVDIIELDIRKSKDGVLYCYHGGLFACLLKYFNFRVVRKFLLVDKLTDILSIIPVQKTVFLDIKENTITATDLKPIFYRFNTHRFWLAAYNLKYLRQLKINLGEQYQYIYNFGFVFLNRGLRLSKTIGINVIKIFSWQCTDKNIEKINNSGLNFVIEETFVNKNKLDKLISLYGSFWIVVDGK